MDTLALVISRATELDEHVLAREAKRYLELYRVAIDRERGAVPEGIAAVLGYTASVARDGWEWPLDRDDASRLGVGPGVARGVTFWAGLRVVNEVAKEVWDELRLSLEGEPKDGDEFWKLVLRSYALSTPVVMRTWNACRTRELSTLELIEDILHRAPKRLFELSSPFSELDYIYRMLSAGPKLRAAKLIDGSSAYSPGYILRPPPEDRIAKMLHRSLGAIYVLGGAGLVWHQYRNRLP